MGKTIFSWSTGKDSALALYYIRQAEAKEIGYLFTTVNKTTKRVSMHGLRCELLEAQAKSLGMPLKILELPTSTSMDAYNDILNKTIIYFKDLGYSYVAYGDIFLESLKKYRDDFLEKHKMKGIYPLWKKDTKSLVHNFIDLGFKAIVLCVDSTKLDKSFVGREIDKSFIDDLPKDVDPCGENGEFHTFCYGGPIFSKEVTFIKGEITEHTYKNPKKDVDGKNTIMFYFLDLIPK